MLLSSPVNGLHLFGEPDDRPPASEYSTDRDAIMEKPRRMGCPAFAGHDNRLAGVGSDFCAADG